MSRLLDTFFQLRRSMLAQILEYQEAWLYLPKDYIRSLASRMGVTRLAH
jgi:hypothetical protein